MLKISKVIFVFFIIPPLVGCGRTSSTQKNIFGKDDREWVLSREHPYSAIGKLGTGCTGTLVGQRLILTAAHCVFDSVAQRPRDVGVFSANLVNGQSGSDASPVRAWIGSSQPEKNRHSDWAIVELSQKIGVQQSFLDIQPVNISNAKPLLVSLVGYNADVNGGITASVHRGCHVRSESEGRLLHDCDSTGGVSGGPLVANVAGKWSVVGISVSEFRNGVEPPVHRDEWTVEYTNVAVPASAFAAVAQQLAATAAQGKASPAMTDVIAIDFKVPQGTSQPAPKPAAEPAAEPAAQPAAEPAAQPLTPVIYRVSQMDAAVGLWFRLGAVQENHMFLNQDLGFLMNQALASGRQDFANATATMQNALNTQIEAWNLYNQYGVSGQIQVFDLMTLYSPYSQLKAAQLNFDQFVSQLPAGLRLRIDMGIRNMAIHVVAFETLVFVRR